MNLKKEFAKELKKRDDKIEKLKSDKAMLQKHILEIKKQNLTNQSEIEELEQYGWLTEWWVFSFLKWIKGDG